MDYNISAETVRLLQHIRKIAKARGEHDVSPLTLLLGILENEEVKAVFAAMGKKQPDLTEMETEMNSISTASPARDGETPIDEDGKLPEFDEECARIIKLSVLESRLQNNQYNSSLTLLLSILHDRENEAKAKLESWGITYNSILQQVLQAPKNDFSFPEEEEGSYTPDRKSESVGSQSAASAKTETSDTPVLDNFGTDLTFLAIKGGLDPVVGRDKEITRIVQILCRRKKNNPIIIGKPGVGKSAIVEGLADRIAHRKVPHLLLDKRIIALDMASVVAGTQYRGQFEERLRRLIQELKAHPNIILFIDEIHTIIGAGSAPGSLDAANILKPALARGEVQCIGATTVSEFKKTIEKDGALERRFQKVLLEPTGKEETETILENLKGHYEKHHNVTYSPEALKACVDLTSRYITDRELPDKAIDAMDEAGASMHLQQGGYPKEAVEKEKLIAELRKQKLEAAQNQNYEKAANLRDEIAQVSSELEKVTEKWQNEQQLRPTLVDEEAVAQVVSMMSGVPVTRVAANEATRLRGMREALSSHVIAQENAVDRVVRAITRSRLGLKGTDRPIGTFLFVGPTGVGKTHLVKCLAEWVFGSKDALVRIDMSEYGEKYSVSRLLGAPPGYVGYDEGGQLTEQVRRHPYSVILLDEIEKAHPDVFNTLLQVMDEGRLTDGNGTTVDFRNTIIILTSNSGTRQLREFGGGVGFERASNGGINGSTAEAIILKALKKQFAPEFLNRLDEIVMFNPLTKKDALKIEELELSDLLQRLSQKGYKLSVSDEAKSFVVDHGFDDQYGARSLKRAIQGLLEDPLCDLIMEEPSCRSFLADLHDGKIVIKSQPEH